jgi:amino acid transporter
VAVVAYVSIVIALGMRTYARVQRFCFWGGMLGLLSVFALLAFSTQEAFRNGLNLLAPRLFGAESVDLYQATIAQAQAQETVLEPFRPFFLAGTMVMIPYIVFFNLWPNWGSTLYGEVKGASDFTRNFQGMFTALAVVTVLAVIFFALVAKTIGWEFYTAANATFWNFLWGYSEEASPLGVWPYPAMLAAFVTTNPLVHLWVVISMSLWWFGWAGTVFLSSTRVIFAAAFDRILPEWVADIHPTYRTPINALLLMTVPSLIVGYLYAYDVFGFQSLTLTSTLVIAVTFLGTSIAATILPYRKPDLYNASPIARYKIFGVPLITVAGALFSLFLLFLLYQWLVDPQGLYGIGLANRNSIIFMLSMYGLAIVIYAVSKIYRSRQGMSLDMVYKEIPVE